SRSLRLSICCIAKITSSFRTSLAPLESPIRLAKLIGISRVACRWEVHMDNTRSPNDPSSYLEGLMQAGQQSFKQFDDAMAAAMGLAEKPPEPEGSPLVAAANFQRDAVLQFWKFWNTTLVKALGVEGNVEPGKGDRRFKDEAWGQAPYYDLLK